MYCISCKCSNANIACNHPYYLLRTLVNRECVSTGAADAQTRRCPLKLKEDKNFPLFFSDKHNKGLTWLRLWGFKKPYIYGVTPNSTRGAIRIKTGKTAVLPWICKIEHGGGKGGALSCYGGLSLPRPTSRAGGAPEYRCKISQRKILP